MTIAAHPTGLSGLASPRVPVAAKLGAVTYILWALLHLQAAWGVYQLARHVAPSMVQARLFRRRDRRRPDPELAQQPLGLLDQSGGDRRRRYRVYHFRAAARLPAAMARSAGTGCLAGGPGADDDWPDARPPTLAGRFIDPHRPGLRRDVGKRWPVSAVSSQKRPDATGGLGVNFGWSRLRDGIAKQALEGRALHQP